ncbi:MAG: DNA polymerase III subunit delta [Candidatus Magasanikbacteria bacterium]|nr:DNA polymerase III subunit delta [Candidatus Magasanikbacteria bacterium]
MIIYIYGDDTFRSREFLRKSVNEFKAKRDPQGYNTLIFDAESDDPGKILQDMLALPFLAEKRMVVIQNLLSAKDKDFLERVRELVEGNKIPDTNVAVVWQGEPIGKSGEAKKLQEILAKGKFAYEFVAMSQAELTKWIIKEMKERGGKIDARAASILATDAGDVWLLNSLIDQLVAFKNGAEIGTADVRLFIDEKVDDNIFNMVDAIISGNKKLAFKLINEQRRLGEDESYLFAMIMRQFKILLQMRDLWEREDNLTSDVMAKKMKLHPFVAKKSMPIVRKFTMTDLRRAYDELLEIDVKTKTGLADQAVLIDFFVGKL